VFYRLSTQALTIKAECHCPVLPLPWHRTAAADCSCDLHGCAAVQLTLAKVTGCQPQLHVQQGTAAFLKAGSVTVTPEIPRFSLNPDVLFVVYKIPPLLRTLSQLNPIHSLAFYLTFISKLTSHLPLRFPSVLFV